MSTESLSVEANEFDSERIEMLSSISDEYLDDLDREKLEEHFSFLTDCELEVTGNGDLSEDEREEQGKKLRDTIRRFSKRLVAPTEKE